MQDHGGALGPEEFKACLISLGYDVENDRQVPSPARAPLPALLPLFLPSSVVFLLFLPCSCVRAGFSFPCLLCRRPNCRR